MTTIKYFKGVKTYKDLKDTYRKLARELHPDKKTGNEADFIAMKNEYDYLFKNLKNVDTDKEYKTHSSAKYDFKDIIDKIIFIDGADIEIIGSWIWVWGIKWDEKEKHEQLKNIGFQYSKNRKSWYLGEKGKYWKKGMSKDQMRDTFGSEKIGKGMKPLLED